MRSPFVAKCLHGTRGREATPPKIRTYFFLFVFAVAFFLPFAFGFLFVSTVDWPLAHFVQSVFVLSA